MSNPAASATQLRGIHQGLVAWHLENEAWEDVHADSIIKTLVINKIISPDLLSSMPGTPRGEPAYYYVPDATGSTEPTVIVAYDNPANFRGKGGNIVYGDGHVVWHVSPDFEQIVAAVAGRARPAPTSDELSKLPATFAYPEVSTQTP